MLASERAFRMDVEKRKYFLQAAHYINGVKAVMPKLENVIFALLACETRPPFDVAFYDLSDETLEKSFDTIQTALQKFKQLGTDNNYNGYEQEVKTLHVRPWAFEN